MPNDKFKQFDELFGIGRKVTYEDLFIDPEKVITKTEPVTYDELFSQLVQPSYPEDYPQPEVKESLVDKLLTNVANVQFQPTIVEPITTKVYPFQDELEEIAFTKPEWFETYSKLRKEGLSDPAARRIAEYKHAPEVTPKSLPMKMKKQFEEGVASTDIAHMMYDVSIGGRDYEEVKAIKNEFEELSKRNKVEGKNFIERALISTAEVAGPMAAGISQGMALGSVAASAAVVAGQVPPLTLTPEELITAPIAYAVGAVVGPAMYWYKQGTGDIYDALRNSGVEHDIASPIANIAGIPYAAIEFSQVGKIANPILKRLTGKGIKEIVAATVPRILAKYGVKYAKQVTHEVGEEILQEVVQVASEEVGKEISNKLKDTDLTRGDIKETIDRLIETGKKSVTPMALLLLPGQATNMVSGASGVQKFNKSVEKITTGMGIDKKESKEIAKKVIIDINKGEDGRISLAKHLQATVIEKPEAVTKLVTKQPEPPLVEPVIENFEQFKAAELERIKDDAEAVKKLETTPAEYIQDQINELNELIEADSVLAKTYAPEKERLNKILEDYNARILRKEEGGISEEGIQPEVSEEARRDAEQLAAQKASEQIPVSPPELRPEEELRKPTEEEIKIKEQEKGFTKGELTPPSFYAKKLSSGKYRVFYTGTNNEVEIAGKKITKEFDTAVEARDYVKVEWVRNKIEKVTPETKPISKELEPFAKEARKYSWESLKAEGKLFKGENLTPEGRIAYLRGIIETNPVDIKEIKYIIGELPFPKKGMQGMTQTEWQKALNMADKVYIIDRSKADEDVFGGGKRNLKVFEGRFADFYTQATKETKEIKSEEAKIPITAAPEAPGEAIAEKPTTITHEERKPIVEPPIEKVKPEKKLEKPKEKPKVIPSKESLKILPHKKQLLIQIDEAIKKAPPISEITDIDLKTLAETDREKYDKLPRLTFQIDGGARIINAEEPLQEFYNRIKEMPETVSPPKRKLKETVQAKQANREDIEQLLKHDKKGWFTDGKVMIKGEAPKRLKYDETRKSITEEDIDKSSNVPSNPAEKLYYYVDAHGNYKDVIMVSADRLPPVRIEGKKAQTNVVFKTSDGKYVVFDQFKLNAIENRYPNAKYKIGDDGMLHAFDKNNKVALLMPRAFGVLLKEPPLRTEAEQAGLIGKKEAGKQIETEEQARELYNEEQEILDRLPQNIGKAKEEGKLSKQQLALLDRLDEIEKEMPYNHPIKVELQKEAQEKHAVKLAEWRGRNREEAKKKVADAGFKEGDRVELFVSPMLPNMAGLKYTGIVKIGLNGTVFVSAKSHPKAKTEKFDLFSNRWNKVQSTEVKEGVPEKPASKEPWEMTKEEFNKEVNEFSWFDKRQGKKVNVKKIGGRWTYAGGKVKTPKGIIGKYTTYPDNTQAYLMYLEQAVSEDKPIPTEILKNYPELTRSKRKLRKLPTAQSISDFQIGRDIVKRRGDRVFVVDSSGEHADIEVSGDTITSENIDNLRKLNAEQLNRMEQEIKRTPYLSVEGKAERLDVITEIKSEGSKTESEITEPKKELEKPEQDRITGKVDDLITSIQQAKAEGKSFDEWVRGVNREEKIPGQVYQPRGLQDAIELRKEGGSLAGYDLRSQIEWLGGEKPTKKLTLYRATPEGKSIMPGDYVTNDLSYAQSHIGSNLGSKGKITKIEATLDDIFPADGPKEFWYAPKYIESLKTRSQLKAEWDKIYPTKIKSFDELVNQGLIRPSTSAFGQKAGRWQYRNEEGIFTVAPNKELAIQRANDVLAKKQESKTAKVFQYTKERYPYLEDNEIELLNQYKEGGENFKIENKDKVGEIYKKIDVTEKAEKVDFVTSTINEAQNGVELSFKSRPDETIIKQLKSNGFRWNSKKKVWYRTKSAASLMYAEELKDRLNIITEKPDTEIQEQRELLQEGYVEERKQSVIVYRSEGEKQLLEKSTSSVDNFLGKHYTQSKKVAEKFAANQTGRKVIRKILKFNKLITTTDYKLHQHMMQFAIKNNLVTNSGYLNDIIKLGLKQSHYNSLQEALFDNLKISAEDFAKQYRKFLIERGFDGIKYKNTTDFKEIDRYDYIEFPKSEIQEQRETEKSLISEEWNQDAIDILSKAVRGVKVVSDPTEFEKTYRRINNISQQQSLSLVSSELPLGFYSPTTNAIYINPEKANKQTIFHEYAHPLMNWIKQNDPSLYHEGIDALKGTGYEKHITKYGEDEAIVYAIGDKGAQIQDQVKRNKFSAWIKKVWMQARIAFKRLFNIDFSLNEFTSMVSYAMRSEKPIMPITQKRLVKPGFMYAGEHATTADFGNLERAKTMNAEKQDKQIIWQTTGWFKGPDNKWRFEIDDNEMELKKESLNPNYWNKNTERIEQRFTGQLGDIIKHDRLFENYRQLKEVRGYLNVHPDYEKKGVFVVNPSFSIVNSYIELKAPNEEELREALAHEIQHWIQDYEGFARGTNIRENITNIGHYNDTVGLLNDTKDKISGVQNYLKWTENESEKKKRLNELTFHQDKYDEIYIELKKIVKPAYQKYLANAGEFEARDVSSRIDMPKDLKFLIQPYSSEERDFKDLIIKTTGENAAILSVEMEDLFITEMREKYHAGAYEDQSEFLQELAKEKRHFTEVARAKKYWNEIIADKAEPPPKLPWNLPDEVLWQKVQRKLQDKYSRTGQLIKKAKEKGEVFTDELDIRLQQELYIQKAADKIEIFQKKITNGKDGLLEKLTDAGITWQDLSLFMYARHAEERNETIRERDPENNAGSGMTDQEAQKILAEFEGKGMKIWADRYYKTITKPTLDILYEGGLLTDQEYENYTQGWKYYVPLKGIDKKQTYRMRGKGFSVEYKGIIKAKGRHSLAKNDPFVQAIMDHEDAIIRAEKNKVGQPFYDFVLKHPSDMWKAEGRKKLPTYNKHGEVDYFRNVTQKLADDEMAVWIKGKQKVITIWDTPLLNAFKNMGVEKGWKALRAINAYLRMTATVLYPEFMLSNFEKDIQTALINLSEYEIRNLKRKVVRDIPRAMAGIWKDIRDKQGNNWTQIFKDFKADGGKVGWIDYKSLEEKTADFEKKVKNYKEGSGPLKPLKWTKDFVMDLNDVIEQAVRVSAYKNAIEGGMSRPQAANLAKNLTVNFNKKGEWGAWLNTAYLFANAGIQGPARIVVALARSKRVRKVAVGLILWSILWDYLNRLLGGDDYEKIDDYIKETNQIFMIPGTGKHLKYKYGYGYNIFNVIGLAISNVAHGEDPFKQGVRVLANTVDSFNPFGHSGSLGQLISPTVGDIFLQLYENKNWFGAPIRKEQPAYVPKVPESQLYFRSVNPYTKALTTWLNKLSGGSEHERGWLDINPENIDHVIDFLGGGTGKFVTRSIGTAWTLIGEGELPPLERIPFVRQVIGERSEWMDQKKVNEYISESRRTRFNDKQKEDFMSSLKTLKKEKKITLEQYKRRKTMFFNSQKRLGKKTLQKK